MEHTSFNYYNVQNDDMDERPQDRSSVNPLSVVKGEIGCK